MDKQSSRRAYLTSLCGVLALAPGCSTLSGSGGTDTGTPSTREFVDAIVLSNRTERTHRVSVRLSREGTTILDEVLELRPIETDRENAVVQGQEVFQAVFVDTPGSYELGVRVDGERETLSFERTPREPNCDRLRVKLSTAFEPTDDGPGDTLVYIDRHTNTQSCEPVE